MLAEVGFHGLSMHKLAKAAGVATGTLYRYFEDKDHLLTQVRLHVTQQIATVVQANISDDMPLKERFRTMWLNIWNLAESNSSKVTICNRVQYESLPMATSCKIRETERKMFSKVDQLFDEGKARGLFKPLDNQLLSALSFETALTLARKQVLGFYQLDNETLNDVIEASWEAIIQH